MNEPDYTYYNAGEGARLLSVYFRLAMSVGKGRMFYIVLSSFGRKYFERSLN